MFNRSTQRWRGQAHEFRQFPIVVNVIQSAVEHEDVLEQFLGNDGSLFSGTKKMHSEGLDVDCFK